MNWIKQQIEAKFSYSATCFEAAGFWQQTNNNQALWLEILPSSSSLQILPNKVSTNNLWLQPVGFANQNELVLAKFNPKLPIVEQYFTYHKPQNELVAYAQEPNILPTHATEAQTYPPTNPYFNQLAQYLIKQKLSPCTQTPIAYAEVNPTTLALQLKCHITNQLQLCVFKNHQLLTKQTAPWHNNQQPMFFSWKSILVFMKNKSEIWLYDCNP